MLYLKERYTTLGLEMQKAKEELERLKKVQENSPLQQREQELSSLETEEKTIAEAEALIDKQTAKEGQNIGEN